MEPIIEFKNFTFKYRSQVEPTLHDINLQIFPGEKVLIVGPSGSGKSTLAHCMNGLVPFSYKGDITGEYRIKGQDPLKLGIFGLSKLVGTVLQDTDGQFIGLTVAEDIAFVLENDRVEQAQMKTRVDEVADMVDVKSLLSHAPRELSGGQKQRVSMAGVMIDDVDILLFDEPLANLDPATGKRAIDLIDRIQKEKQVTIVIIEHRLEDVLYRDVDRIIVVGDGRIVADTTPDALLVMDVLEKQGIREPLYLTALKHAGCQIAEETKPQHIETMLLDSYKEKVKSWFQSVKLPENHKAEETVLEIQNLQFAYMPGKPVLQDIQCKIQKGEMVSIVGKNGAGKSTLSSLICGFISPQDGKILLHGEDMKGLSIKERGEHIGLVMQNPNQMISKPMIYDEVALGLQVRGVPEEEIKQRVYDTLKICGLYPFRNWPVSALSFGQKKRVTIASILVLNPEVLILDEPTGGLDEVGRRMLSKVIQLVHSEGHTVIIISHDMDYVAENSSRVVMMAKAHILSDSTPDQIFLDADLCKLAQIEPPQISSLDMAIRGRQSNVCLSVEEFVKRYTR